MTILFSMITMLLLMLLLLNVLIQRPVCSGFRGRWVIAYDLEDVRAG